MISDFSNFTARLRDFIQRAQRSAHSEPPGIANETSFNELALELFRLQFAHNAPYRRLCKARGVSPQNVTRWAQIPAAPTAAFKEFELSCLPEAERTAVFHSSGTTAQRPSRHFHNAASLAIYRTSSWPWFCAHVVPELQWAVPNCQRKGGSGSQADKLARGNWQLAVLTPPPARAPHSSLVCMFETVRREFGSPDSVFVGTMGSDGAWGLDLDVALGVLRTACGGKRPLVLLGTAFSFVHLLDHLVENDVHFNLPPGSRAMETGGYKGRSRNLPKANLHALITQRLGIPPTHIVCEYGMSELSSQAYDNTLSATRNTHPATRHFRFPPWARTQIVSPETGREVVEGETGLIRVVDLANVFSAMVIQTEDLGSRRGDGFELVGRTASAETRGCSLLPA